MKTIFSLEEIKKAIALARDTYWNIDNRGFSSNTEGDWSYKYSEEEIIQSLPSQHSSKQFSLEDMETLMEEALNWFGGGRDKDISDSKEFFEKFIQSLSIQQLQNEEC